MSALLAYGHFAGSASFYSRALNLNKRGALETRRNNCDDDDDDTTASRDSGSQDCERGPFIRSLQGIHADIGRDYFRAAASRKTQPRVVI